MNRMIGDLIARHVAEQGGETAKSTAGLNRRGFLTVSALGGAGFLIGCSESNTDTEAVALEAPANPLPPAADAELNAFIRVQSDNTVTVVVKHLDKGQGVTTGLPAIVAEELGASWAQMRAEFAPADAKRYANMAFGPVQGTGGSTFLGSAAHGCCRRSRHAEGRGG